MSATTTPINPAWSKPNGGAKVAVIGCGPGGMFVCHALETERRKLLTKLEASTSSEERVALKEKLDLLPKITCFEQADAPGGVWRSTRTNNDNGASSFKSDTNMYEALWCNGPKDVMEFPDFSFEEFYGKNAKLPLYLPRQAVLDYILTRVTRHCPTFFDQYAVFNTKVNKVTYDADRQEFTVVTTHVPTQTTTTALYDKVIWSAGQNGSGSIPGPLLHPFEEAKESFAQQQPEAIPPPFLHASSMEQKVADNIKDRHLLLIGGSYSAEDLAFMGIKWGAKHVTILTRRHGIDVPVCWTANWPDNKVTVVAGYVVEKVQVVATKDRDPTYSIALKKYAYEGDLIEVDETNATRTTKEEDEDDDRAISPTPSTTNEEPQPPASPKSVVDSHKDTSIENVDVVICCTGYSEHLDMLDKSCYNMTEEEYNTYWNGKDIMELPADWTMPKNQLTGLVEKYFVEETEDDKDEKKECDNPPSTSNQTPVQHIPPKRENLYPGCYVNPYSYREFVFVKQPNLFWLAAQNFDAPLMALDVQATYAVKFLTGEVQMPTTEQMQKDCYQQALMEMSMPMVRYWMDTNYYNAVQKWLDETTRKIHYLDDKGNRCSRYEYPQEWADAYRQTSQFELHLLAQLMKDCNYPLQLGDMHELNDNGKQYLQINWGCRNYSTCSKTGTTFRDVDAKQCETIQSVLTGSRPAPLNGRWLDMDDFMENVTDMVA